MPHWSSQFLNDLRRFRRGGPQPDTAWPRSCLFDRRLIEGVDPEQVRRDDGRQYEMHEQFAEARLVEPLDFDRAHRTAVLGQRLGGGAALRGDEIADGFSGKAGFAGQLGGKPRPACDRG